MSPIVKTVITYGTVGGIVSALPGYFLCAIPASLAREFTTWGRALSGDSNVDIAAKFAEIDWSHLQCTAKVSLAGTAIGTIIGTIIEAVSKRFLN